VNTGWQELKTDDRLTLV